MMICEAPITRAELQEMAECGFGRDLLAIDADLHADLEAMLLERGSSQNDLWGINLYPDEDDDFIEFDSLINIRPMSGNRSRGVDDPAVRQRIIEVVEQWTVR